MKQRSNGWRVLVPAVLLLILGATLVPIDLAGAQEGSTASPEQQLADRFAPVVMIKEQSAECSPDGEPFLPVAVDVVFNDPDVALKRIKSGDETEDPVIMMGPTIQDIAGLDDTYYLDLPGNSLRPGCTYEKWGRERMAELGIGPSVYARVATEEGVPGLVVQYWFYWVFNDFNNTHESDWEMLQLMFDASSAEEVLEQNLLPSELAYAQHEGGEKGSWDDGKVTKSDTHTYTYPASGSHADYYESAVWIGWGENGSGFGCDDSRPTSEQVPIEVILIPDEIDPQGPFGWLTFEGRWGERQYWQFNGPTGPNMKDKWPHPISWTDDIRSRSIPAPHSEAVGPGPTRFFCSASEFGGAVATVIPVHPTIVVGGLVVLFIGILAFAFVNWRYIWRALKIYVRYLPVFLITAALVVPIAMVGTWVEELLMETGIGASLLDFAGRGSVTQFVLGTGIGSMQQLLILSLVAPVVIYATFEVSREDRTSLQEAWRLALERWPRTVLAILLNVLLLTLMAITIVLIPLAIYRAVQWLYVPQAVIIDNEPVREARHVSRAAVKGHWLRTLGMAILIGIVSGVPGPIIAVLSFIFGGVSMEAANWISSIIYALAYPLAVIASTLYYLNISHRLRDPISDEILAWKLSRGKRAVASPAAAPGD